MYWPEESSVSASRDIRERRSELFVDDMVGWGCFGAELRSRPRVDDLMRRALENVGKKIVKVD
ncbi:hypothetical protein PspLS_04275 [Pyricularia sp. CBS 133598]|nr:hypothetical protein PspLS_04275 [Pyricularia sp. CBS 133598]